MSLGFTFFFCVPSYISGVHLLLLRSQLYLWGSPSSAFPAISLGFTFFFCVPSYISGVHLLLLRSQLYLLGSPSSAFPATSLGFTFFCVPSYISGVHLLLLLCSPAISLGFTFFFFCCVPHRPTDRQTDEPFTLLVQRYSYATTTPKATPECLHTARLSVYRLCVVV